MQNNFPQLEKKISLPTEKYSKIYTLEIKQTVTSMNEVSNNTITLDVEKNFIKKDDFGYLFSVIVKKRTQTNTDGLRNMENFLSRLQHKTILRTDETGNIKSIANHEEIKELWNDSQNDFFKKFKRVDDIDNIIKRLNKLFDVKEDFLSLFKQSEIGTLLFPPIYFSEIETNLKIAQQKFYKDFFGPYLLPFRLQTELHHLSNKKTPIRFTRFGNIDQKFFNEDEIKLYFRRLYQTYNLSVNFETTYVEIYDLNNSYGIDNAFQLFGVKVGECYSFDQIVTVKS